ncbi:hypothetical protein [Fusobacterium russii]|uniref:hypothetical protein n=1 Tax=Fusobacterium russii TaxID=854 RepID=UPI00039ECEF3|nr:hypothetical protein [Fusobacterium russii]
MIDFNKINQMIKLIENNEVMEGYNFNDFAVEFYSAVKLIPLSKYLRTNNIVTKLPKIMNMRKAGELLSFTRGDEETLAFLKRKGYPQIPDLDYRSIMLLRKIDPMDNWKKVIFFLNGDKSVEEINNSTKPMLFPQEIKKLEDFIKVELNLDEDGFEKFMKLYDKATKNKEIIKAMRKLSR